MSDKALNRLRLCVLISGSGTNLQALLDARASGRLRIDIVHVISNVADARGLERARAAGVPCSVLEHQGLARDEFDRCLALLMAAGDPQLMIFAGFMRIVGDEIIRRFKGRMINLHPSLLPKYPGLGTYRRALEAGDDTHGASIHFLTATLDGGPVISRVIIPVESADTPETLRRRLAPLEHQLVVATIELFQDHRVECHAESVMIDGVSRDAPLTLGDDGVLHDA